MFNVIGEDEVNYIYESDGIYYNAENNQPLSIDLSITNEEQETLKRIHNISENDGTLFYDILENAKKQKEETFKNSLIPASMGPGKGMRINLEDGSIIGYNIYFKAMKSSSDGKNRSLIINTSAGENEYPLMIGSHFKVDWEGRLWCDNITIGAGSSPQSLNYAININNKFVVDSSGNGFWAG
jgi:hypothetical protein